MPGPGFAPCKADEPGFHNAGIVDLLRFSSSLKTYRNSAHLAPPGH